MHKATSHFLQEQVIAFRLPCLEQTIQCFTFFLFVLGLSWKLDGKCRSINRSGECSSFGLLVPELVWLYGVFQSNPWSFFFWNSTKDVFARFHFIYHMGIQISSLVNGRIFSCTTLQFSSQIPWYSKAYRFINSPHICVVINDTRWLFDLFFFRRVSLHLIFMHRG